MAVEGRASHVQARGDLAAGERQVQVRRSAPQQEIDQRHARGVRQLLQLIEGDHERRTQRLKLLYHHRRTGRDPTGAVSGVGGLTDDQAGVGAGDGDVGIERVGCVARVERQPCGGHTVGPKPSAALRKQHCLAEPPAGFQHRQPALRRHGAFHEAGAVKVAGDAVGQVHTLAQQPGRDVVGERDHRAFVACRRSLGRPVNRSLRDRLRIGRHVRAAWAAMVAAPVMSGSVVRNRLFELAMWTTII